MHEMSIAQGILDVVDEYMAKEDGKKLLEVAVQVGELVAVVPDSLIFCYDALVDDTSYQGSKLSVTVLPLTGKCSNCQHDFKIENYNFICPQCQETNIEVSKGQELKISHLEVE